MSYRREEYQEYLKADGKYNTSPYCSCLDKIEKKTGMDIDKEYDTDKCARLLQTLLELRGSAADDAKKYGQFKNLISKLNKYCQFRNAPDQPDVAGVPTKKEKAVTVPQAHPVSEEPEETFFYNPNRMTIPMEEYIQQCQSFDQFKERYLDQFAAIDDRIGTYLEKLLWKYEKNQATVSRDAGLVPAHVGNIVRGRINDPARDVLIAICLAIGTTVDEVQHLLRYAGHAPLYVRRMRDVIIWFGFMKKRTVADVNLDLEAKGEEPIIPKRKDTSGGST